MSDDIVEEKSMEEEYLNNWKRAQADLANYKKEEMRRMEELVKYGNEAIILEVLDVVGNLELAAEHLKDEGLKQVIKQFERLLKKYGVERIVVGDHFDPNVHEAVDAINESKPLEEVRPGYTLHGRVIRPARIKNK
ncbi:MAG: nucleotide exchange factor GrpE [Patescibacteria group bacterium]